MLRRRYAWPNLLLAPLSLLALAAAAALLAGCDLFGSSSPDGPRLEDISGKIVYSAPVEQGGDNGLQVFVTDQEGTRQLTSSDEAFGSAVAPAWSPDGERIAFGWDPGGIGDEELYVMNADGSEKRPLVNLGERRRLFGTHPAWSPSGNCVAFQRCTACSLGGSNTQIFVVDLESGRVDTLTGIAGDNGFLTWSLDGEQIAFISDRAYTDLEEKRGDTDLYVMSADGSGVRQLEENVGAAAWSPGDDIAFGSNGDTFLLNVATGEAAPLEADLPEEWGGGPVDWSNDGQKVMIHSVDHPELHFHTVDVRAKKSGRVLSTLDLESSPDWFSQN